MTNFWRGTDFSPAPYKPAYFAEPADGLDLNSFTYSQRLIYAIRINITRRVTGQPLESTVGLIPTDYPTYAAALYLSPAFRALRYCTSIIYLKNNTMNNGLGVNELVGADVIKETSGLKNRKVDLCEKCYESPCENTIGGPSR